MALLDYFLNEMKTKTMKKWEKVKKKTEKQRKLKNNSFSLFPIFSFFLLQYSKKQ